MDWKFEKSTNKIEKGVSKVDYTLAQDEIELLDGRSINQLKDIVKNHEQYGYTDAVRYGAIEKLGGLGISEENLKV